LISRVENDESAARDAIIKLYPLTGNSHVIGITGPPGSGKSTLVNELTKEIRSRHHQVGIIAVDPSSPFTGGAFLGDRVRMMDLAGDDGLFIRSMASRGSLGGLARTTGDVVKILDAAGFDTILVETVGAGQAEVDIASTAHTTLVIETPGMGDEIQSIKAGILEIADILVVNKADRPNADRVVRALKAMLRMGKGYKARDIIHHHGKVVAFNETASTPIDNGLVWEVPVFESIATEGEGISPIVDIISAHKEYLLKSGEWESRERIRSQKEIKQLLTARFMRQLNYSVVQAEHDQLIGAVARREIDPYSAADKLFQQVKDSG
jgi:LAO/AO transport system kinase